MLAVDATASSIEAITTYIFTNKMLCAESVQMASPKTAVIYDGIRELDSNKRLSILGDAVLTKVSCAAWYEARHSGGNVTRQSDHTEYGLIWLDKTFSPAQWTIIRNELLSNDALAQRGFDHGVEQCVFVADGTYRKTSKMVATTLEAIIGAILEDGGDDAVMRVITHLGFFDHRFLTVTFSSLLPPWAHTPLD
jgi:ribonuclease-3